MSERRKFLRKDNRVWTDLERQKYVEGLRDANRRTNFRIGIAFIIVVISSIGGSAYAGHQSAKAGARSGTASARAEVLKQAKRYAYQFTLTEAQHLHQGCVRGNHLRGTLTSQSRALAQLSNFILHTAQAAWFSTYQKTHNQAALLASRRYSRELSVANATENFKFPQVQCDIAYPLPVLRHP